MIGWRGLRILSMVFLLLSAMSGLAGAGVPKMVLGELFGAVT